MNNSPATRPPRSPIPYIVGTVIAAFIAFAGVLQLGNRLDNGEWVPLNPVKAVAGWMDTDRPWGTWHTVFAVLIGLVLFALLMGALMGASHLRHKRSHVDNLAKYMGTGSDLTLKAITKKNAVAGYTSHAAVGIELGKGVAINQWLYAGWRSTVVAIMGPGSGKTTALAIPEALKAPGWVYGTSNKRDFPDGIWKGRAAVGTMAVFDPQRIADVSATWFWNPLTYVTDDTHAIIQANLFADAAKDPEAKIDGFFDPKGRVLLAGLLLAAACTDKPITQLSTWVSAPNLDTPAGIIRNNGWLLLGNEIQSIYDVVQETKRGIFANTGKILSFLFNRDSLPWLCKQGPDDARPEFDPHAFVRSRADTLISLSKEGVGSLGPVVSALTIAVLDAAEEYAKTCPKGRLPIPGVAVLDEAANAVRDKALPDRYSHYGSRGICPTTILQSRAQGEAAWGKLGMDKLMGASTHRIYGRGIDDDSELRRLSTLIGDRDELQYSTGTSQNGGFSASPGSRSVNSNYHRVSIMDPATVAALPEWRAILHAAGERPVLLELVPHMARPGMKELVEQSEREHGPTVWTTT